MSFVMVVERERSLNSLLKLAAWAFILTTNHRKQVTRHSLLDEMSIPCGTILATDGFRIKSSRSYALNEPLGLSFLSVLDTHGRWKQRE